MNRSKLVLSFLSTLILALVASHSHAQTLTTLLSFSGTNGENPQGNDLTLSADGSTLYGMTPNGGSHGYGNIFSIPVTGGTPTNLLSFNITNGLSPTGSLTLSGSTLYGMTNAGGGTGGYGNVFSIPASGGTPTNLGIFNGTDGQNPNGSLTLSGSTFYGVTPNGGANNDGTVFSIPLTGGTPTVLGSFNGTNGDLAYGSLTLSGSTLFGMSNSGGANGEGNIFSIPVTGGTPTNVLSFNGTNGEYPDGNNLTLIGSTLYGMTPSGGANGDGIIFSIPVTGGTPTTLGLFDGTDGRNPYGSLTLSTDGSTFYGMTSGGGASGDGSIFSIPVTGGSPTTLFSFNGANGNYPLGSLTLGGSTLYGMTYEGGTHNDGTVFALSLPTPEPSSAVLLGLGAIAFAATAIRRRMRRQAA